MNNLGKHSCYRIYKCLNKECQVKIGANEIVADPWQKLCPFCGLEELVLESAKIGISVQIDANIPKTVGMIGQKNRDIRIKEGKEIKDNRKPPFWRKNKKINYNILQNPQKYINEGHV